MKNKPCCNNQERCREIIQRYLGLEESTREIGEAIGLGSRQVQRILKDHNSSRTLSESYKIAIKQGRMKYDHLRKDVRSKDIRRTVNPKLRMLIMSRDKFRCLFCGGKAPDYTLQIDHIDADVSNNNPSNLQTLCMDCNVGKGNRSVGELVCNTVSE